MAIKIMVVFGDGSRRAIGACDTFEEAADKALDLANTHCADHGDGAGPPTHIEIVNNGKLAISIAILSDGLIPPAS